MIRPLVILLAASLAIPAAAQVTVKSGEHADFSRLVFYLPEARDWRLGRIETGYGLRIAGERLGFDLEQVFDFIPRRRIAEISVRGSGIDLRLACTCHANAFEYRPGIVVVDVKDGAAPPRARFEAALVSFEGSEPAASSPTERAASAQSALPALAERVLGGAPSASSAALPAPAAPEPAGADSLAAFRETLLEEMGLALSEGLVRPAAPDDGGRGTAGSDTRSEPSAGTTRPQDPAAANGPAAGFAVATGFALAVVEQDGAARSPAGDPRCIEPAALDFFLVGSAEVAAGRLAAARMVLYDEAGRLDRDAVLDVARSYLALGFGAEAAATLSAFDIAGPEVELLADLAAIVDRPGLALPDIARRLAPQAGCNTGAAMWAVLATGGRNLPVAVERAAVLRSASALPVHLRRHLVPPLSEALRVLELPDLADAVRATIERTGAAADPALQLEQTLAAAELAAAGSRADGALGEEPLAETATARSGDREEPTPAGSLPDPDLTEPGLESMARIVRRMAEGRDPPDPSRLREAEALLHSAKGGEASVALFDVLPVALARSGRHGGALDLVARMEASAHSVSYDVIRARNAVVADLVENAGDGELVLLLASRQTVLAQSLPASLGLAAARRLAGLGLPDLAARYAPPVTPDAGADILALHAEIALVRGEAMEALGRVAALQTDAANRVRAAALDAAGADDRAVPYYDLSGAPGSAVDAAWIGADWATAARRLPDGPRRDLAARLALAVGPGAVPPGDADPTLDAGDAPATDTPQDGPETPAAAGGAQAGAGAVGSVSAPAASRTDRPVGELARRRALVEDSERLRAAIAELAGSGRP